MIYRINEVFTSIQGEGVFTGRVMNFIRFTRCNLNCNLCDTDYTSGKDMSVDEIMDEVDERVGWVSLTGGEPLMEEELTPLIKALKRRRQKILLETNGTLFNEEVFSLCDFISADIKTPSTGNPIYNEDVYRYCVKNPGKTQIKMMIKNQGDFSFFKRVYKRYPNWILQPEWSARKTLNYKEIIKESTGEMLKDIRVIPQIHKTLGVR